MGGDRTAAAGSHPLPLGALVVQPGQQVVRRLLDLVVVVVRCALLGVDQRGPVDLAEVAVREAVAALRVLSGVFVDGQVPLAVPVEPVLVDLRVLLFGGGCGSGPLGRVVVGAGVDELAGLGESGLCAR